MRRMIFLYGLLATCSILCTSVRCSAAWESVTRNEIRRESTAHHNGTAPAAAQPGAPTITVEEPDLEHRITAACNASYYFQATRWC